MKSAISKLKVLVLGWIVAFGGLAEAQADAVRIEQPIIATGMRHGLFINADGTVWVWGSSGEGQLGMGINWQFKNEPQRLTNFFGAKAAAAGTLHSLVLTHDGKVWAFGDNNNGELGLGFNNDHELSPTNITSLSSVAVIEAGDAFSMSILENGTVKSWGNNSDGQLGVGNTQDQHSPVTITSLNGAGIIALAAGKRHSLALSSNGTVYAWGENSSGQLGDGLTGQKTSPQLVPDLNGVIAIAAGQDFSMALRTNRTVWVWGEDSNSRLGLPAGTYRTPTELSSLSNICSIKAGSQQGYALDKDGKVWAWGYNQNWGVGVAGGGMVTTPTNLSSLGTVLYLSGSGKEANGNNHLSAALDASGRIRYWGEYEHAGLLFWGPTTPRNFDRDFDTGYEYWFYNSAVDSDAIFRGGSSSANYASFVIPIDFQKGTELENSGGVVVTNLLPFFTNSAVGYHYNSANSPTNGQTNLALRIPYQNPIAAFGLRVGGTALYAQRSYRFITYAGLPTWTNGYPMLNNYSNALKIDVYSRSDFSFVGTTDIPLAHYLLTNSSWAHFLSNGLSGSLEAFGLTTRVSTREYPDAYGVSTGGALELTFEGADTSTNYVYVVKMKGAHLNGWVSLGQDLAPVWQPLYTLEFEPAPPWNVRFLSQVHFEREPLPSFYDGKSPSELLTSNWKLTNVISLPNPISSYTNVDQSPELRVHPDLDRLVEDLKHDPIALARFVQNEIETTDALDYLMSGQLSNARLNLAGINRGALGVYRERQGSPTEQCALLIYLLRRAGVPAVYAFPQNNGMMMLDLRLSKMLRFQLDNSSEPTVALVNYPWVAAYIDNKWVHLFPWIKDMEVVQGPNLYDFMPENYNNVMKWILGYVKNRPEIIGNDTNEVPEVLFPRLIKECLRTNAPGLSFDQLGLQVTLRKKAYNAWDEFPTPTWVSGTNLVADTLSDPLLVSSTFYNWNPHILPPANIFNTVQVEVLYNGGVILDSQPMRTCDTHGRALLVFTERTDPATADSALRVKLSLAPFRSGTPGTGNFTFDPALTNRHAISYVLPDPARDMNIRVTYIRYRTEGAADVLPKTIGIKKGDLNAVCLNWGRVSKQMLEPLAEDVWETERAIKQNPSLTNSLTTDQFQGPLTYLMGMAYYEKVNRFIPVNASLHGRSPIAIMAIGLAKLLALPTNTVVGLPPGPMVYVQPSVDMLFTEWICVESPLIRSDSGENLNNATDNFGQLIITDGSAKEHDIINGFFKQADAISTVKLLQLASRRHATNAASPDMLVIHQGNVLQGAPPNMDSSIWSEVTARVMDSPLNIALVTPGNVANDTGSYNGSGALIFDRYGSFSALISGANGGWGSRIPSYSFSAPNLGNVSLGVNSAGNYSVNFTPPSQYYHPFAMDSYDPLRTLDIFDQSYGGLLTYTPFQNQSAYYSSSFFDTDPPDFKGLFADTMYNIAQRGFWGWVGDGLGQIYTAVSDPVHCITGEFFINTSDLSLAGPLPLEVRRNYSSLNMADNEFGIGWKMSFAPYLSFPTNGAVLYAAEPDGSVLVFERSGTNANVWIPTLNRNPGLVNNRQEGVGSTANLLLSKIVQSLPGGVTNFHLYSPNGDVRRYETKSFNIPSVIDRTRPYLTEWTDSRGNKLRFSYGANSQDTDFGELRRVDASNGGYLVFRYDIYGHMVEAISGDGRQVSYRYDDFGDLVKTVLADGTEISYEYQHGSQSVTNIDTSTSPSVTNITQETYSMHLLVKEVKPEGRLLGNVYDSQRRVIFQSATVGTDLKLYTNATFVYANNFVLTNDFTNTISGYTTIADAFNKVTRYDYTNSRVTKITDPLAQTIEQEWCPDNAVPPEFPRSVKKSKDKRGLWTEFKYDQFGNVTNTIITGDLTGAGGTQTASTTVAYNADNLPVVIVDAIGNSNVIRYDSTYRFSPKEVVSYQQGVVISTNAMFYGTASNLVTFGNATWTNVALGLLVKQINAYNSPDAATNQWFYDGRGFVTNEIRFTSTTDPAINNTLFYNGRGELFKRVDTAGRVCRYDYDGLGRTIAKEEFEAGQTTALSGEYFYYNHNGDLNWYDGPQYNPEDYAWYDYDGMGRKTAEVRWRSRARDDGYGLEAETGDDLFSITSFEYDKTGNLIKQIDPVGNYSLMAYDALGQLTQQAFYAANNLALATNRLSYEPGGKVANATNSLGGVTQTLYTQTGHPRFRQNSDGSTNGWVYDLLGRIRKEILHNGSYWETTYDDAHRQVSRQYKNAGGAVLSTASMTFDRRGNTITNVTADGAVFFSVYDALNRQKVSGGPATVGGVSTQQIGRVYYDNAGIWTTNENSLGQRSIVKTDALGRPVLKEVRDVANGNALVSSETTLYDADHHGVMAISGTGAGIVPAKSFMDSFGNAVLTYQFPALDYATFTRTKYDRAGRLVQTIDQLGQTAGFTYDGLGRVSTQQLSDGATIVNTYNSEGTLTGMTMPNGMTWSATYSKANQLLTEKLSNGASVTRQFSYVYNTSGPLAGRLQKSVDTGRAVTTTFAYDAFLRPVTVTAAGSQSEQNQVTTFQYDRVGRITSYLQTSPANPGSRVSRRYDAYGQLLNEQVYVGGVLQSSFDQTWDAAGRRSSLKAPTAQFDYGYRVDNRMSRVSAFNSTYNFSYGDNGLLVSRSNPWRTATVTQRDNRGLPLLITTTAGAATPLVEAMTWRFNFTLNSYGATRTGANAWNENRVFNYNSRDQLTNQTLGLVTGTTVNTAYRFDTAGLGVLTSASQTGGLNNNWATASGSPDVFGRTARETLNLTGLSMQANGWAAGASQVSGTLDGNALTTIAFNPLSKDGAWSASLNLTPASHTLNVTAVHRSGLLTTNATSTFTVAASDSITNVYDNAGNVVSRSMAEGTQTLKWDAAGRLVSVTLRNAENTGYNWSALYDALGRRLRTTHVGITNGVAGPGSLIIDSFYDPQREFQEIGVAVNGERSWKVFGPDLTGSYGSAQGLGGLEATVWEPGLQVTPVVQDTFGNVLASVSGGQAVWNPTRVDGYGPVLGHRPPTLSSSRTLAEASVWRGKKLDPTGYYYLGARHYDPIGGRFLSPDPVGHSGSMDLYSFANGDPINQFDFDGRFASGAVNGVAYWMDSTHASLGNMLDGILNPLVRTFGANQMTAMNWFPGGHEASPISMRNFENGSAAYQLGHMVGYAATEAVFQAGVAYVMGGFGGMAATATARTAGAYALEGATMSGFTATSIGAKNAMTVRSVVGAGGQLEFAVIAEMPATFAPARATQLEFNFGLEQENFHISLMGKNGIKYYDHPGATLGGKGGTVWVAPGEDYAGIANRADAVTATGHAKGALTSYLKGDPIYGIAVPKEGIGPLRLPTSADAGANKHWRPGGYTGVEHNGTWRSSNVREFVTPGGAPMPQGSIFFELQRDGSWKIIRRF